MKRYLSRLVLPLCLGAIAVLDCACSSDDTGDDTNQQSIYKKYDPCELVTLAEAEAALGVKLAVDRHDTEPSSAIGNKICFYELASGNDMKFVQISLNEQASMASHLTAESLYNSTKSALTSTTPVAGVGDDAYYGGSGLKAGAGLWTLVKSKGVILNLMVGLGTGNTDEAKHIEIEKGLALKAIARL